MQSWQLQAAKARFSELVKHAALQGPQDITVHGRSVAVVVSRELFDRLSGTPAVLGNPRVITGVGVTHLRYPVRKG